MLLYLLNLSFSVSLYLLLPFFDDLRRRQRGRCHFFRAGTVGSHDPFHMYLAPAALGPYSNSMLLGPHHLTPRHRLPFFG